MSPCLCDITPLQVRTIIAEHLGIELDLVSETSVLGDDLGCDSLDTVELIMEFESNFDIKIDTDSLDLAHTVAQVIDFVQTALTA